MPKRYPIVAQQLLSNCPTIAPERLLQSCPKFAQRLPQRLPQSCTPVAQHLPNGCPTVAHRLPRSCPEVDKQLPHTCPQTCATNAPQLPNNCPARLGAKESEKRRQRRTKEQRCIKRWTQETTKLRNPRETDARLWPANCFPLWRKPEVQESRGVPVRSGRPHGALGGPSGAQKKSEIPKNTRSSGQLAVASGR